MDIFRHFLRRFPYPRLRPPDADAAAERSSVTGTLGAVWLQAARSWVSGDGMVEREATD
jgi:hypothetical protein